MGKWGWNLFLNPNDNVWARLVKDKYFSHIKFMDYKILRLIPLLLKIFLGKENRKGTGWKSGDVATINF